MVLSDLHLFFFCHQIECFGHFPLSFSILKENHLLVEHYILTNNPGNKVKNHKIVFWKYNACITTKSPTGFKFLLCPFLHKELVTQLLILQNSVYTFDHNKIYFVLETVFTPCLLELFAKPVSLWFFCCTLFLWIWSPGPLPFFHSVSPHYRLL